MKNACYTVPITPENAGIASDILSESTGISRARIKDAMNKGAVWLKRAKGPRRRLRRAKTSVMPGDTLELYYDEKILALSPDNAVCLADHDQYSVWYKPAGLLTQGTNYGDHISVLRQAERLFSPRRGVFLVHRLDREAKGLVLLAHSRNAAAKLSGLFRQGLVEKHYRVEVLGDLSGKARGVIDRPLDGKGALTTYEVHSYNPETNTTVLDVEIKTGRLHQIRRHLSMIGFPVMGDPRYGRGNRNTKGMMLEAVSLAFICPLLHEKVVFTREHFLREIVKVDG